jgi:hypothetical protein
MYLDTIHQLQKENADLLLSNRTLAAVASKHIRDDALTMQLDDIKKTRGYVSKERFRKLFKIANKYTSLVRKYEQKYGKIED